MSADPILLQAVAHSSGRLARVEYVDFRDVSDHREYRLVLHGPGQPAEVRFRIAMAAFGPGRVRLQDGPEVCYQKLLRMVAAGEQPGSELVMIDDTELASFYAAHAQPPKRGSWAPSTPPKPKPRAGVRPEPRPRLPQLPVAGPSKEHSRARLDEGQRVAHAVFGAGVVASSDRSHTVVCFDDGGRKRFLSSMVKLEVLSAPHTWETGPRGHNRPRAAALIVRRRSHRRLGAAAEQPDGASE